MIGCEPGAIFSRDRRYRYLLRRRVDDRRDARVTFIGLNPSVADERDDDHTIRRCIDFARRWGAGCLHVVNLSPLVATCPEDLEDAGAEPRHVAARNRGHMVRSAVGSSLVIAAWGRRGALEGRDERVVEALRRSGVRTVHCLAVNADGTPRHPLYVAAATRPSVYLRP